MYNNNLICFVCVIWVYKSEINYTTIMDWKNPIFFIIIFFYKELKKINCDQNCVSQK